MLILRDLFFFLPIFRRRRAVELGDNRDEAAALVELMILKSNVISLGDVVMEIDVVIHNHVEDGSLIYFGWCECPWNMYRLLVAYEGEGAAHSVHEVGILGKIHLIDVADVAGHDDALALVVGGEVAIYFHVPSSISISLLSLRMSMKVVAKSMASHILLRFDISEASGSMNLGRIAFATS